MSGSSSAAVDRVALSRERLREAMRSASAPHGRARRPKTGATGMRLLRSLQGLPGSRIVIDAISSWWSHHPLRVAGMVTADAANALAKPVAQRHPLGLVLSALLVGGVFAWSRPWRWMLRPALFAGLLPQLFSKAMAQMPPSSWMTVLSALLQEKVGPAATPPSGEPSDPR